MKIDFKKAIILSFKYSTSLRKLPYYFLFQIFTMILMFFPLLNLTDACYSSRIFENPVPDPQMVDFIVESFGYFFLSIVLVLILSSILTPTFIFNYTQYRNKKDDTLKHSLIHAKPYFLTVFGAFITMAFLINIIGGILSMIVQVLGTIVSFMMTLAFIFVIQDIVIRKSSISNSLSSSYKCTTKNFTAIVTMYLVTTIFSIIITLFFGIPLIFVLSHSMAPLFGMLGAGMSYSALLTTFASTIRSDIELYLVSIITLLLGSSISKLFSMAFITETYLQLRAKK
ncbi:MAG: hypothetical protein DRN71_04525 [Candidatus Nanohalarchaeota archaeon]|nr:MAG: hypothetical protein DRN71_04525 [Candidatus Nanohaloarchaeota archaeon]